VGNGSGVDFDRERAEATFFVGYGTMEKGFNIAFAQRSELKNLGTRNQGAVDRKERVFSGRANQKNLAGFNIGQEDVLLSPVETMNFVEKQYCTTGSGGQPLFSLV
jgi:hypothetical protein